MLDGVDREIVFVIGTDSEELRDRIRDPIPETKVFVSGLEWLNEPLPNANKTQISRLLLVDRNTILVSSFESAAAGEQVANRQCSVGASITGS